MIKSKHSKLSSKILIFLLVFSLVTSPFQMIVSASTEENEQTETDANEKTEDSTENQADEVIEETSEAEISEDDANQVEAEVTDEEEAPSNIDENVEENSSNTEDQVDSTEASGEETDEDMMDDESNDYSDEAIDYSDFSITIDEVSTTSNSITVSWSTTHDILGEFDLYLDNDLYTTVSSDTNTYTFTDLTPGEYYWIEVSTTLVDDENYGYESTYFDTDWVMPDWSEDELVPVSIITMFNDDPTYNEEIRIRGLDESNKAFTYDNWLYSNDTIQLPYGTLEVTIYNQEDPSIATVETIKIKKGVDYLNNPIQLQIRLKEMTEAAEPFQYEVEAVTDNSFTLRWNNVSKITGLKINAWEQDKEDKDSFEFHSFSEFIENKTNEYTFTGLNSNKVYSIDVLLDYVHELERTHSFKVKTDGEDARDEVVNLANEKLDKAVADELGIYFRDITKADMGDLTNLSVYNGEINSLDGMEYAHNLRQLALSNNHFSSIDALVNLTNIEYLYLSNNQIVDISPLEKLNKLSDLTLWENHISTIDTLANLTNLEYLSLAYNQIKDISPVADLIKLQDLNLRSNDISDINALANLSNLNYLYLDNNQIEDITSLENLTKLTSLSLESNNVSNIDALANLTNLDYLDLAYNQIRDISPLADQIKLQNLSLHSNDISDIHALANLTNLEYLYLSDNQIIDISALTNLETLTSLNLNSNEISDITALSELENLEYLDISYNNITDITPLKDLPRLQTVYLYGMDITDTETIQFLRNEGVEVYYDRDYGDWNDWDDEWNDEEDIIIDREEVLKQFPEDHGFIVSDDGKTVELDLGQQSEESFELSKRQIIPTFS